jgi:hypothetical protein
MTSSPKKPGVVFWATVVLVVVLVAYPLSFGPARWLYLHDLMPAWLADPLHILYQPLFLSVEILPDSVREPYLWYLRLWGN